MAEVRSQTDTASIDTVALVADLVNCLLARDTGNKHPRESAILEQAGALIAERGQGYARRRQRGGV